MSGQDDHETFDGSNDLRRELDSDLFTAVDSTGRPTKMQLPPKWLRRNHLRLESARGIALAEGLLYGWTAEETKRVTTTVHHQALIGVLHMFAPRSLPIRRSAASFAIALTALLAACDETLTAPSGVAPVSTVQVVGSLDAITAGEEREFSARLRDAEGALLAGRSVSWNSSDASVATVSATGRVTAISAGTATIRAISEGRQGSVQIEVRSAPVVSIVLSELHVTLDRNSSRQVQATARDAYARPVLNAAIDWISDDPSIALVSSAGQVTAIASGTTRIVARVGGIESSLTVTVPVSIVEVRVTPAANVLSVGVSHAYAAQVIDDRGGIVSGAQVIWSSSTPSVAAVSSTGLVTAVSRGYATITARVGAVSGSVALTVVANEWQYEANLFEPALLLKSDTTTRTEHVLAMRESRLTNARFSYNFVTQAWTFTAEVVHSERSELQGNVMWRETGRETVTDYGFSAGYDMVTGRILMRSARTNTIQFLFASWQDRSSLRGKVGVFPVTVDISLTR